MFDNSKYGKKKRIIQNVHIYYELSIISLIKEALDI